MHHLQRSLFSCKLFHKHRAHEKRKEAHEAHNNHAHTKCVCVTDWVRIDFIYGFEWHVVVSLAAVCFWHRLFYFLFEFFSTFFFFIFFCELDDIDCLLRMKLHLCPVCVCESMLIMRTLCTVYSVYGAIMLLKKDTHSERIRDNIGAYSKNSHFVEVNNFVSLSETWQTDKFHFFSHSYFMLFMSLDVDGRHNKKRITSALPNKFDQYTLSLTLSHKLRLENSGPKCIPIIFIIQF